jgi:predicted  nucleic acid-binding Zn-ribbon protein
MNFASDMMNLRHEIDALRRNRQELVDQLRRFGNDLQTNTNESLSAIRTAMHEEHTRMREERAAFNAENQRGIHQMMQTLHSERAHARRNFIGKQA